MSVIAAIGQRRVRDGTVLHVPGSISFLTRTGRTAPGTFSRASGAWDGAQVLAANTPRRVAYGGGDLLLLEAARTNLIRNSSLDRTGDTVLPRNWNFQTSANATATVRGYVVENGVTMLEFSVTTANSANLQYCHVFFDTATAIASAPNKIYSLSVTLRRVSTPPASETSGHSVAAGFHARDSSSSYLNEPNAASSLTKTALSRITGANVTVTNANTAYVTPRITLSYPAADAATHIYRIAMPQFEEAAYPSSYIPTTTGAVTRAAELWRIDALAPLLAANRPWTLAVATYELGTRLDSPQGYAYAWANASNVSLGLDFRRYSTSGGSNAAWVSNAGGVGVNESFGIQPVKTWGRHYLVSTGQILRYVRSGVVATAGKAPAAYGVPNVLALGGAPSGTSILDGYLAPGAPALDIPLIRPWAMSAGDIAAEDARWAAALNATVLPAA